MDKDELRELIGKSLLAGLAVAAGMFAKGISRTSGMPSFFWWI